MSRVSVVIFGATGYTGKHAAVEMAKLAKKRPDLTWAIAGRAQSKLEDVLKYVADATGEEQKNVRIIIADVKDEPSLVEMCKQAHVVANCCGPYRLYGEPVVRAAIQARAHHVDVTGEPQFIDTMQLKYDAEAREAGVYIVSACGFDSVPNDMGVVFLQQNFGGTLNSVESYLSSKLPPQYEAEARAHGVINTGTWESLIYGLAHWSELKPLREKMFPTRLPAFHPRLLPQRVLHSKNSRWCLPFPGADNSIVYRTQRALYETAKKRPAQFRAYVALDGLTQALALMVWAVVVGVLARFEFTRNLLIKYPRFFTAGLITPEGPAESVVQNTSFRMELYGEGWGEGGDVTGPPNKTAVARVSGQNPGYGFTVVALLLCAITILDDKDKMPAPGGVLTTGTAFRDTSLIQKLNENGAKFEMVSSSAK